MTSRHQSIAPLSLEERTGQIRKEKGKGPREVTRVGLLSNRSKGQKSQANPETFHYGSAQVRNELGIYQVKIKSMSTTQALSCQEKLGHEQRPKIIKGHRHVLIPPDPLLRIFARTHEPLKQEKLSSQHKTKGNWVLIQISFCLF